jgi:ankyrin repeat protein
MLASKWGHTETVELLLQLGANVKDKDSNGKTAVMLASEWGHADVVKVLLRCGANVDDTDSDDMNAVKFAIKRGHLNVFFMIMEECYNFKKKQRNWLKREFKSLTPIVNLAKSGTEWNVKFTTSTSYNLVGWSCVAHMLFIRVVVV